MKKKKRRLERRRRRACSKLQLPANYPVHKERNLSQISLPPSFALGHAGISGPFLGATTVLNPIKNNPLFLKGFDKFGIGTNRMSGFVLERVIP